MTPEQYQTFLLANPDYQGELPPIEGEWQVEDQETPAPTETPW